MGEPAARGSVDTSHGEGQAKTVNGYYQGWVRWSQWSLVWWLAEQTKKLLTLGPMMSFQVRSWMCQVRGESEYWSGLPWRNSSSWRIPTWRWMWSGSRYIRYRGRWIWRSCLKKWDEWAGENRRQMRGRSWTANWTGRKASMHEKTFKLLWQMDSTCKWSTADVGPLKGNHNCWRRQEHCTETDHSFSEINFQEFLLTD